MGNACERYPTMRNGDPSIEIENTDLIYLDRGGGQKQAAYFHTDKDIYLRGRSAGIAGV